MSRVSFYGVLRFKMNEIYVFFITLCCCLFVLFLTKHTYYFIPYSMIYYVSVYVLIALQIAWDLKCDTDKYHYVLFNCNLF